MNEISAQLRNIISLEAETLHGHTKIKPFETDQQAIDSLLSFLEQEEEAIDEEHKKPFVTDIYENDLRAFTDQVIIILIPLHSQLEKYENYKCLLRQRHIAFSFYHIVNWNNYTAFSLAQIREFDNDIKTLYLGLVDFYYAFYGSFHDNEEAIELMCKYYPEKIEFTEEERDKIAAALYSHISNAGTPLDRGFAFNGITLIEKYIDKLHQGIVEKMLMKYTINQIVLKDVYRKQIHTVIKNCSAKDEDRRKMKIHFLDLVLMIDRLSPIIFERYRKKYNNIKSINDYDERDMTNGTVDISCEPRFYWDIGLNKNAILYLEQRNDKKEILEIIFDKAYIVYIPENKKFKIKCDIDNWRLNEYWDKEYINELRKFIGETFLGNHMTFSMVYLDKYRGLKKQVINFDHRYTYNSQEKKIESSKEDASKINHFYGEKVESLTCIVGKNGTGKTSIIDFIRETFFKMLIWISKEQINCECGIVDNSNEKIKYILDKSTDFLVIFNIDGKSYLLSNIEGIDFNKIIPFSKDTVIDYVNFCKVVYFSNMIRNDQLSYLNYESVRSNQTEKFVLQLLSDFIFVDYSENSVCMEQLVRMEQTVSARLKSESPEDSLDYELFYKLVFLKNIARKEIEKLLGIASNKEMIIRSEYLIGNVPIIKEFRFTLDTLQKDEEVFKSAMEMLVSQRATLGHFSSGQYAKLSFLAKLYWFLNGSKELLKYDNEKYKNAFSNKDVLIKDGGALIFIDEGELYYHPEWQRRYIKELLELVNSIKGNSNIQIVISSNSPFMLSDVLQEDIIYLTENEIEENIKEDIKEDMNTHDLTLGQNIHTLLKKNFFMDFTIGEYARQLIDNIITLLVLQSSDKSKERTLDENEIKKLEKIFQNYFSEEIDMYDALKIIIEQIGEPVYRNKLLELLENSKYAQQREEILHLKMKREQKQKELEELNAKIESLEGRNGDDKIR